jgi:hypothetical protein
MVSLADAPPPADVGDDERVTLGPMTTGPTPVVAVPRVDEAEAPDQLLSWDDEGDHDGDTIAIAVISNLDLSDIPQVAPLEAVGTKIQAVRCPSGHANPPHVDRCRNCGAAIAAREIAFVQRPPLGRLRFSDGLVVQLDSSLVLGRKPTASVADGPEPRLITLPDPDSMLSRTHAEIRLEDWQALVVDLSSRNGTVISLPGQRPVKLRPHEPVLMPVGSTVDLGGVARFVFEVGGW